MISPQDAKQLFDAQKAILVDVREHHELEETGYAEGALWMPTSKMEDDDAGWIEFQKSLPKDKKILVYCRSGQRSGRVAFLLQEKGFEAENLGGFSAWKNAGLPVAPFRK